MSDNPYPHRLTLTNKIVDALMKVDPRSRRRRYWDEKLPGFFLGFSKAGSPSFCIRYTKLDGKDGEFSLGRADVMPIDVARKAAAEKLAMLSINGVDPVDARRSMREEARAQGTMSFAAVTENFIDQVLDQGGKRKGRGEAAFLRNYVVPRIGHVHIDEVDEVLVENTLADIQAGVAARCRRKNATGKQTANGCHKVMKRLYRWANKLKITKENPVLGSAPNKLKVVKRRGRLDEQRFHAFWNKLESRYRGPNDKNIAIKLYMSTLQRPVDIARAEVSEFNLSTKTWRIPEWKTKTKEEYVIPLSDVAVRLVKQAMALNPSSPWLFPRKGRTGVPHMARDAMSQRWLQVRDYLLESGDLHDEDIELYDCRRFGRTQIHHALGFGKEVAERVINHAESSDMDHRYDVHDYEPEVRRAQEAWGSMIERMVAIPSVGANAV